MSLNRVILRPILYYLRMKIEIFLNTLAAKNFPRLRKFRKVLSEISLPEGKSDVSLLEGSKKRWKCRVNTNFTEFIEVLQFLTKTQMVFKTTIHDSQLKKNILPRRTQRM